jgi:hypothetical protein
MVRAGLRSDLRPRDMEDDEDVDVEEELLFSLYDPDEEGPDEEGEEAMRDMETQEPPSYPVQPHVDVPAVRVLIRDVVYREALG